MAATVPHWTYHSLNMCCCGKCTACKEDDVKVEAAKAAFAAKAAASVKRAAMKEAMTATDQEWKTKWVDTKLALVRKKAMKAMTAKAAAEAMIGKSLKAKAAAPVKGAAKKAMKAMKVKAMKAEAVKVKAMKAMKATIAEAVKVKAMKAMKA
jgi:hypothetical protein